MVVIRMLLGTMKNVLVGYSEERLDYTVFHKIASILFCLFRHYLLIRHL